MKKTYQEPQRRLSPYRVLFALLFLVGAGYSSVYGWNWWQEVQTIATQKPWFAAYVDVTSTPTYAFEQIGSTPNPSVVLSFIVSSHKDPCVPTWGAYYDLDQAGVTLDLDRRIARLQQQDGHVAISFGGALNDELSFNCRNEERLLEAYAAVIDRYKIDTIDLDLENRSLSHVEAAKRRAQVIAKLQQSRRSENKPLAVWLTLPVTPHGLTEEGTNVVAQMLAQGVDLAGVNVMTMNYGESRTDGDSMDEASQKALTETHRQLGILYKQAGFSLNSSSLWRKIGATPMIGQNDIARERFTLEDAQNLNRFARDRKVGRMSMWSANRDVECSDNYVDVKVVSDGCSGVSGEPYAFTQALSQSFDGDLAQSSTLITQDDPDANQQIVDDPETSPYQIWFEKGTYVKGSKVVLRGHVYEAKWWTRGDLPDNPVLQSWETPWQLIGPVLEGEKPIPQATLPTGTYPEWNSTTVYQAEDRVLFDNIPYEAKFWNQSQSPDSSVYNPDSSAWQPLTQLEIEEILEETK
jgi:chitinase